MSTLDYAAPAAKPELWEGRFEARGDGCWYWTGPWNRHNGYGDVCYQGTKYRAHRVVYTGLVGPVSERLDLDHLCRNTLCVNPDHLEPVTHRENMVRGEGIGGRARWTHCSRGHEYTPETTMRAKNGTRRCRVCFNAWHREYSRKRRSS